MKKKWFYIISIILSIALIATGVVFLFIVNYGIKKPDPVEITTSNSKTYIKTSLNENSSGYIFKFKNESKEFLHSTKNNLICADNLIDDGSVILGENYKVSVCYKNDYENGNSNFSDEKDWLATKFLVSPTLYVNGNETIGWNEVENADKYQLHYTCGNEKLVYETTLTSVSLSVLEGGEHNFYVIATSKEEKFLDSEMSNIVTATSYHNVRPFALAQFKRETKELTINVFEDVNEVEVWTGTNQNDATLHLYTYLEGSTNFTKTKTSSGYLYTIKVNTFTPSETYIAVRPRVSGYNVYNGDFTIATIK